MNLEHLCFHCCGAFSDDDLIKVVTELEGFEYYCKQCIELVPQFHSAHDPSDPCFVCGRYKTD